jgi:alpha-mannosidase
MKNVMIEVVKKAEDSEDVIIRLYEYFNRRSSVKLMLGAQIKGVWECDLMENELCGLKHGNNDFQFEIKPFEIKTFKLKLD